MSKQIKSYLKRVKSIPPNEFSAEMKEDLLIHITFYSHERLVHLLVLLCFAVMTIVMFVAAPWEIPYVFLRLALTGLLIPYIGHYYFLENSVQELYSIFDSATVNNE